MPIKILVLTALLATPSAFSAESLCTSPSTFRGSMEDCDENHLLSKAAEHCKREVDKEYQRVRRELEPRLKGLKASSAGQDERFQTSKVDYTTARNALYKTNQQMDASIADIYKYMDSLILPNLEDIPEGEQEDVVMSIECYGKERDKLEDILDQMEKQLDQADHALLEMEKNAGISSLREARVGASGGVNSKGRPAAPAKAGKTTPAGSSPKGKGYRPSDISGTEKTRKK